MTLPGRRLFLTQALALASFPLAARKPLPPKTANIHWPGATGELHGYMAIPARAHGPQPAVLVVHDAAGADAFTRGFADGLATAGFVACVPNRLGSLDEGIATVRWLATNAYATGKVAAVGLGWGGALVDRIAAAAPGLLAAGVTFGASALPSAPTGTPLLRLAPIGSVTSLSTGGYDDAWRQTIVFLKEHLA